MNNDTVRRVLIFMNQVNEGVLEIAKVTKKKLLNF